ncbi:DUF3888 domain-containing protein [Paenactinomyces guangxiensis]|uniref:DUF3888 domain-containing protein n=1 Tax=Paenactinomyces guangxiensis TaxID=1490290 RepID=A0A7W1WRP8_9BACL|nr:DUF3888 domain-containing protein [Paenactinomyces guangxiensis]MBA4494728.1 DUF3888 domain-containing protein [Paenactinomyces guangxiensis]MBH8591812.1 DUF3888 domain-containing protein [Paenactinomyces guangxiensis]
MKKATIIFLCMLVSLFCISASVRTGDDKTRETLITNAFKTTLTRAVDDAIVGYYGKRQKSFSVPDIKIKEIEETMKGGYSFLCKLEVPTYEGQHDPPYGLEKITLEIGPAGVSVLKFEHEDVP